MSTIARHAMRLRPRQMFGAAVDVAGAALIVQQVAGWIGG
jgi:hypothetical protein